MRSKINRMIELGSWAVTALLMFILFCNIYMIVAKVVFHVPYPSVFGYSNAVVLSGSMEPAISVNDMIMIHEEDQYEIGDIVSYKYGDMLVTHRIVDKTETGYVTQGDANNARDDEISKEMIVGKIVFVIPSVGILIQMLQTPLGMLVLMLICYGMFVIPNLFERKG